MEKVILITLGIILLIFSGELGILFSKIDLFAFDAYSDEMMISFISNSAWSFKILGSLMIVLPIIKNQNLPREWWL